MAQSASILIALSLLLTRSTAVVGAQGADATSPRPRPADGHPAERYEPVFEELRHMTPQGDRVATVRGVTLRRDVIMSGGDPLLLSDRRIEELCKRLRSIPHLEIIRIGSRVPCHLPERITPELCAILKKYHPLYINTHFNHPDELTPAAVGALGRLADAGVPLGCQTVLLKGVNDDAAVMKRLMQKLLAARVRPYYIYMCDQVAGAEHFRTTVEKGLEIIKALRGWTSGLAVPHFVIDAPGGGGKIPLLPEYVESVTDAEVVLRNYAGQRYVYKQPEAEEPILVG